MTTVALVIVAVSAFTHAGWNLLGKSQKPNPGYFLMIAAGPVVWALAFLSGLFQSCYYMSLSYAYCSGDLSMAYPIARSLPVILVAVITSAVSRDKAISAECAGGIALAVIGCFMLPMKRFTEFRLSNYTNVTCLAALIAALATTAYSITDKATLEMVRPHGELLGQAGWQMAYPYYLVEGFAASAGIAVFVLVSAKRRRGLRKVLKTNAWKAAATGFGIYLTYSLILVAMTYVKNVSYVVAFRQLSIPLGTMFGIVVLREPRPAPKILGVLAMVTGLVLVAIG
jgi:drug/metabolite transporter (DMT)-like permease